MKASKLIFILAITLILVTACSSNKSQESDTTYYVSSSSGNDSNDGLSPETAWKTLDKASSMTYEPGNSILLKSGDTFEEKMVLNGSGTLEKPILFSSYGEGKKPLITHDLNEALISGANINGWTVRGLELYMRSPLEVDWSAVACGISIGYNDINYNPNSEVGQYSNITISDNEIYGLSNKTDLSCIGIAIGAEFFIANSDNPDGVSADYQRTRVLDNITITDNYIHDVGLVGIYFCSQAEGINASSPNAFSNIKIERNIVHDTALHGVMLQGLNNGSIKHNKVYNTGKAQIKCNWGVGAMWCIASRNLEFKFNDLSNALDASMAFDGVGFDIDWASENILVQYNKVYDCYGAGIDTMSNVGGKILNNYVFGNKGLGLSNNILTGQITLTDFNDDQWGEYPTGCFDVTVSENLIVVDVPITYAFSISDWNQQWAGNAFTSNHVVYKDGSGIYNLQNIAEPESYEDFPRAFDEIDYNKFYMNDSSEFLGRYDFQRHIVFDSWKEKTGFDVNSEILPIDETTPSPPTSLIAKYAENKMKLTWLAPEAGAENVWHYNIYRSEDPDDFPMTYWQTMVGESKTCEFIDEEESESGKTYYYRVESESNCGIASEEYASASAVYK